MRKFYHVISLYLLSLCILIPSLEARTFHAILVGDTKDKELHDVIKKDMKHMEAHLNDIFDLLPVDYYEQTSYTGRDVNTDILEDLAKLTIQPDDIVFFYFSGHGFYAGDPETECWPNLYLSQKNIGINQLTIMEAIKAHNPQLLICFADCCNHFLDEGDDTPVFSKKIYHKNLLGPLHAQQLFMKTEGIIMISSASPEYAAEGTDEDGSCFTNSYIKNFKKAVKSNEKEINWDIILSRVQKELWDTQKPQYKLMLK